MTKLKQGDLLTCELCGLVVVVDDAKLVLRVLTVARHSSPFAIASCGGESRKYIPSVGLFKRNRRSGWRRTRQSEVVSRGLFS